MARGSGLQHACACPPSSCLVSSPSVDPDHPAPADQHDRRGRSERLRQVQHHRRGPLDGRKPAKRLRGDSPTDVIFRFVRRASRWPGDGRAGVRQQRPRDHRRIRGVQRDLGLHGQPRRPERVLPQRRQSAAAATSPTCSSAPASARAATDHRAGMISRSSRPGLEDCASTGGSRRHLQVQGTAQGN